MRKIAGIFGVAGLLLSIAAIGFAADPPKEKKTDEVKDKISKLAEDIFTKADKHNHGFLNKYEFKKADNELIADITEMAKEGLIGKGRPAKDQPDAKSATPFNGGFADADTDKDKKVTLTEFTDYVTRAIQAADAEIRAEAASQKGPNGTGNGNGYRGAGGRR
jgi:hypothetical protein